MTTTTTNNAKAKTAPNHTIGFGIAASFLFAIGCAHGSGSGGGVGSVPATDAKSQAAHGATLYADHCGSCHGDSGQGTPNGAPSVVGKDSLPLDPPASAKYRNATFHTARDVYDFVKANMPAKAPGTLSQEQYLAIIAFDLSANGVDLSGKPPFTPESLSAVVLHP